MRYSSSMRNSSCMLFALIFWTVTATTTTFAFVWTPPTAPSRHVSLAAKKPKRSKAAPTTATAKSGGGFGKAVASKESSSSSPLASIASVIPFSGHSGSGTKALRKVANQFDKIRKEHQNDDDGIQSCCRDVYVRSPLHSATTFWFVGKIASVPPPGLNDQKDEPVDAPRFLQTARLLKRIILEYAKDQLRPTVMGGKYASTLELWLAPGDSEMDAATNKVNLYPVVSGGGGGGSSLSPNDDDNDASQSIISLTANDIGYDPEVYVGEERIKGGLRVERDENGRPTKLPFDVNLSE